MANGGLFDAMVLVAVHNSGSRNRVRAAWRALVEEVARSNAEDGVRGGGIPTRCPHHVRVDTRARSGVVIKMKDYVPAHVVWLQYHPDDNIKGYDIHHINGNINDNRICNLIKVTRSKHMRMHKANGIFKHAGKKIGHVEKFVDVSPKVTEGMALIISSDFMHEDEFLAWRDVTFDKKNVQAR
jgi:hypothetical protein